MSEPEDVNRLVSTNNTTPINATVTVNSGGITVNSSSSPPYVVNPNSTQIVCAGDTTSVNGGVTTYTYTTYLLTFTQGNVTFKTFKLPASFNNTTVSVGPSPVTPSDGTFVLTCVDQNTTASYFALQFGIPATLSDGTEVASVVDPTMIFNPPRGD